MRATKSVRTYALHYDGFRLIWVTRGWRTEWLRRSLPVIQ